MFHFCRVKLPQNYVMQINTNGSTVALFFAVTKLVTN